MSIEIDVVIAAEGWAAVDLEAIADRAVGGTLQHLGVASGEVAILACDDDRIAALNGEFRGRPRATDVLSWPAEERGACRDGAEPLGPSSAELGDIAIALGTSTRDARNAGLPLEDHLTHLIVHATLHLLGYDHERMGDAALMERIEIEILGKMGLADPYSR